MIVAATVANSPTRMLSPSASHMAGSSHGLSQLCIVKPSNL